MDDLLSGMVDRRIDLHCGGGASLRGKVLRVANGVLHMIDEDEQMCFVAIDKIAIVWEARDDEHRAGFVSRQPNNR